MAHSHGMACCSLGKSATGTLAMLRSAGVWTGQCLSRWPSGQNPWNPPGEAPVVAGMDVHPK